MTEKTTLETELQVAKEDLEDLETYIEEFSSFLPLAVCTVNPVGIIININESMEDLSGYNSLEIVGEPLINIFADKKGVEKIEQEIINKESVHGKELALLTKDKKEIPVSVSASIRKDGKGDYIGYFIGITDITELKKFQEGLEEKVKERTKELEDSKKTLVNTLEDVQEARNRAEEERDKTQTIITNFVDGLLVFDKDGKLSLINSQAEYFLSIKSEDALDKNTLELKKFPVLESLIKILGAEIKSFSRKELPLKENLVVEASSVPLMRGKEKVGNLVVLHDVTREKFVEKMKSEFVSLAAHQLRTPLSVTKWSMSMLQKGDFGKLTKEQGEVVKNTFENNEKLIFLVNDLLDVARIEEGRYLYKTEMTDIAKIVSLAIDSYKDEIKEKKIKVSFEKPDNLPKIMVDAEKIRLVAQNFIDNAIKYSPAGGKVIVSLQNNGKDIQLKAQDFGTGIPKSQQDKIFVKFFRGENAVKMNTSGSGLGLFLSKNIVEAHGGRIWFESDEKTGTSFYFSLPVKKGEIRE